MGIVNETSAGLNSGIALLNGAMDLAGLAGDGSSGEAGVHDETARMMELDAREQAADWRRKADEEARRTREAMEKERATDHARWGQSGLALSGSKEMVLEGSREQDREVEANQTFVAEQEEQSILDSGLRKANVYRINRGRSPKTTLSLGSTIYKRRS